VRVTAPQRLRQLTFCDNNGVMGPQPSERAITLAIFGILISLILAILSAVKAPSNAIVVCATITVILIIALYLPVMARFARNVREERQRKSIDGLMTWDVCQVKMRICRWTVYQTMSMAMRRSSQ
jgi:hypothetical protein